MTSIYTISLLDLFWVMIPVSIVIYFYMRWTQDRTTLFYALFRMIVQLILIGYVLTYIFSSDSSYLVILILSVMLVTASVIAFAPCRKRIKTSICTRLFLFLLEVSLLCLWLSLECWI